MAIPPLPTDPIFILGISQRSGTNFLFDLLCLHPDCGAPSKKWEDFLLHKSDLLVPFVDSVYAGWRRWGTDQRIEYLLYEHLGNGLISVLASQIKEKRLVTKTPSVRNLSYFFKLFPHAYLLILVRDGRAVAESRVKSFGENYEFAIRNWADGADAILKFIESAHTSQSRYLIVRYEDLCNNLDDEMRRVLAFVGLDAEQYDFNAATNMPVRGSSVFHGEGRSSYHWNPVQKAPDFNPVARSRHWTASLHERFNWITGDKLKRLGYEEMTYKQKEWVRMWRNTALDIAWQLREFAQSTVRRAKNILKSIFGADRMSRCRRYVLKAVNVTLRPGRALLK